jgi:hypothetical protein
MEKLEDIDGFTIGELLIEVTCRRAGSQARRVSDSPIPRSPAGIPTRTSRPQRQILRAMSAIPEGWDPSFCRPPINALFKRQW